MKKQNIFFYSFLMIGLTVLSGCFEDAGTKLLLNDSSNSTIEIQEATTATGLIVPSQYERKNDGILKKDSLRINLNGPQRSTPIDVSFIVDPSSTAVAGFHYNLVTTGGVVTIPANSNFGYIRYTVNADKFQIGETFSLKISISSATVKVNPNYSAVTRNISVVCPSDLTGTFTGTQNDETGFWGDPNPPVPSVKPGITITRVAGSPNQYDISDITAGGATACGCGFAANQGARIQDVCGIVHALGRTNAQFNIADGTSVSTWNPATKTLTLYYKDVSDFPNYPSAGNLKAVFVKQ